MSISPARPLTIALDARILQGEDAWRGIGHYSQGLIEALLVHQEENRLEIVLILSRERPEPELQTAGARAIRHIAAPDPSPGPWRKIAGRLQDEASSDARALEKAALGEGADLLHILSPLHGPSNWRATRRIPCAATVYDLIPLKDPAHFLDQWPEAARERYLRRVKQLRDVDLLFPISHAVRSDLIDDLGLNADRITVASPGLRFDPDAGADSAKPRQRFLMALCSRNPSKNLPNLLSGYAGVPLEIRSAYPLHLFCPPDPETRHWLEKECAARSLGEEARIEPAPSDSDLLALYRDTTLFILPSLAEGFGLPALEAGS
ncbi:glycosyltransferase, partial [bacterium]|nr:glycosyltransferase [bacterium]